MARDPNRDKVLEKPIKLQKGLSLFRVNKSPYYRCKVWDSRNKKNIIRSTQTASLTEAKTIANEMWAAVYSKQPVEKVFAEASKKLDDRYSISSFVSLANELIQREIAKAERGECHHKLPKNTEFYLFHNEWGAADYFGKQQVTEIGTPQYLKYIDFVRSKNSELRPATMNHIATNISKTLKLARDMGFIQTVPDLPRTRRHDNPRAYFKFHPVVEKEKDEYRLLLDTARRMAKERMKVRETVIDYELYDMIVFLAHSFLRPTESEFYGVKHKHVSIQTNPKSLQIDIPNGKTGSRVVNTMPQAVSILESVSKRYPDYQKPDDYLFFPQYRNRGSAKRIAQRIFNACLIEAELKDDAITGEKHSLYSMRHTAISMRIVLSQGKTNIYTLAKNAGTSVNQIERFYASKLPLQGKLVENLQSFGD